MASHDPSKYRFSTPTYIALFATLLTAYYLYVLHSHSTIRWHCDNLVYSFDTSMSQKSRFKMQTQGIFEFRKSFPQLPNGTVENPTFIQTAHGYATLYRCCCTFYTHSLLRNRLLTGGWWAYARKPVSNTVFN